MLVAVSALAIGAVIFFLIPRFTTGYLSALNLQPGLMTGFSDDVTLDEIGKIQKNSSVVMRIASTATLRPPRTSTGAASPSPTSTATAGSRPSRMKR